MELIEKLLEIAEEMEQIVSINGLRYQCIFAEQQEMRTKDSYVGKLVTMIYRYCEPLEEESIAYIYLNLEKIEERLNY